MKVFQLATLFGSAASAVQSLVGRDDGTVTSVVYTSATYTITKCAASVTNCPVASATEVFTSTTVMSVTTTICAVASVPGLLPPASKAMPSSSGLPVGPPGMTNTQSDSVPTSHLPGVFVSSSGYIATVPTAALPTGSSLSVDFSVSLISPNPSLPTTGGGSSPDSSPSGVTGPSSVYGPPAQTPALPSGVNTVIVPGSNPSGSVSLPGSLTDSIPISSRPAALGPGSSAGSVHSGLSTITGSDSSLPPTTGTNTRAVATSGGTPSIGNGQSSTPSNTATDAVATSGYAGSSVSPSSGANTPSVSSATNAVPTSSVGQLSGTYTPSVSNKTNAVPTSGYLASSAGPLSGASTPAVSSNTNAVPTSGYLVSSAGPSSGTYSPSVSSNTNAVLTSGYLASNAGPPSGTSAPSAPTNAVGVSPSVSPSSGYIPSFPNASGSQPVSTYSVTDAIPTSGHSASSVRSVSGTHPSSMSSNTNAVPVSGTNTAPGASSLPLAPSYPATNAVPTSGYAESSVPASSVAYSPSASGSAGNAAPSSGYPIPSGPGSVSLTDPVGTITGAVPTSAGPGASDLSSGEYSVPGTSVLPSQGTSAQPHLPGSIPVRSSRSLSTGSGTYPAVSSVGTGSVYPETSSPASTTFAEGTTGVTSRLTLTSANYVTAPAPSGNLSTDTDTDAVPTSRGTGYLPSGYPQPPSSANGTIIAPTPSYIEVPVNIGQIVAVGQGSFAAIVVALAFALFA